MNFAVDCHIGIRERSAEERLVRALLRGDFGVGELAEVCGVGANTVRKWRDGGEVGRHHARRLAAVADIVAAGGLLAAD